ncbi:MAG TPA: extracellular solute-binding protein, partial [Candidatus Acidoferrum sp.]|nr:extracellular solute-binding protein [Candidatus Acidoferrum sp.]
MRAKFIFLLLLPIATFGSVSAKTTLEWWQFWTDPDIRPTIQAMVADFEKANPDISVNMTDLTWADGQAKIAIAMASGTGPDVVELGSDWIAQFASSNQLADISAQVASDSAE